MRSFDQIFDIAADRKGGRDALNQMLDGPLSAAELAKIPADRWLAEMTKGVFRAGFNWKVVESMWPGFEAAFNGFDIGKCAMLHGEDFDRLVADKRIIRYGAKIKSVQENAVFIQEQEANGGISKLIAEWPATDFIGLLALLKKDAARLGGTTGQYCLRSMGKDSFILSRDVVARLVAEGVVDKAPTSKKAMGQVQEAFNTWMDQSDRSLTEVSRVLAMSV